MKTKKKKFKNQKETDKDKHRMGCLGKNLQESGRKSARPFCHRDTLEGKKDLNLVSE